MSVHRRKPEVFVSLGFFLSPGVGACFSLTREASWRPLFSFAEGFWAGDGRLL